MLKFFPFYFYIMFNAGDDVKKKFLNSAIRIVEKKGNYSEEQLEIIRYGLEGLYLTVTKSIVLFGLAYIFNVVREFILLLVSYNIIRTRAFGIHASKSMYCLMSSIILFICGALLCKYIYIPYYLTIIIAVVCDICLFLYAPADTHKRPLVNEKKRRKLKIISVINGIVYTIVIIIFKDSFYINYLIIGMIEAVLMILPITYRVFKLPYANYRTYYSGV